MMKPAQDQAAIKLSALFNGIVEITTCAECSVHAVQTDSRELAAGDLFIALPGVDKHGLDYLNAVLEAGAACIVFDQEDAKNYQQVLHACEQQIRQVAVEAIADVAGVIISRFYGNPSQQLQIIAVTGTDGKTSVSRFIAQALSAEISTAVIGTTGNGLWGQLTAATHTTPDVLSLHKMIYEMKQAGADCVVMEVSSHGIEQKRIAGVNIDTAILTNVSRDHLDYHGSVENYRAVKKQLFSISEVKNIVLNLDDEVGRELAESLKDEKTIWTYSLQQAEPVCDKQIYLRDLQVKENGFMASVVTPEGQVELNIPLLGRFNVANVLALLCVLLINKFSLQQAQKKIAELETAPGRMELFDGAEKSKIVVDYAHTPKALELALQALAEHSAGKLWCVFGCGGERDQGKRALMGAVAEKYADVVIVTDDNPRNEDSDHIIEQVLSGFQKRDAAMVIKDRKAAIDYAFLTAANDDVILVAGKGHEEYQLVGNKKIAHSDRGMALRLSNGGSL
ncbi:MAG: UDP-N-acetylmuramoyl-L-alanyl-D-glutamate--2,6-diaminopimelate ligase [Gammaproteobacteria bacterium]|nr:UDP-N-acetylmuramoyl-L-alanyl-D-glutamate--2,6-diaminopimelate ligase [Gammaproteobacteria bacterium]